MYRWILVFCVLSLSSCKSKDGDFNIFSVEDDIKMGEQYRHLMENEGQRFPELSPSKYSDAYVKVNNIIESILKSDEILHRDDFVWQLHILHDDTVLNAFCTPGGYIYVYTGLIKFLDSEDQLAGVLGHEIAHADLRHSTEQLTKNYGLSVLIRAVLGDGSALGNAAGSLLSLTFSRSDETEADMQSVAYLTDTDYDPRGVARFFEKMESKGETMGSLEFLSTHPNPENRVDRIFARWKELGSPTGKRYEERYKELKNSLP